jgi:hypothetical protein
MWKEAMWINLGYYTRVFLEELREVTKKLQDYLSQISVII